jgi:hypothetical protein
MKKLIAILAITVMSNAAYAEKENTESASINIKQALDLALAELPEGKEITSIALQEDRDGRQWYFAEYGIRIVAYETKEMNSKGELIPTTKYRKQTIGATISIEGAVKIDQLKPRSIVPRRRVILPAK